MPWFHQKGSLTGNAMNDMGSRNMLREVCPPEDQRARLQSCFCHSCQWCRTGLPPVLGYSRGIPVRSTELFLSHTREARQLGLNRDLCMAIPCAAPGVSITPLTGNSLKNLPAQRKGFISDVPGDFAVLTQFLLLKPESAMTSYENISQSFPPLPSLPSWGSRERRKHSEE